MRLCGQEVSTSREALASALVLIKCELDSIRISYNRKTYSLKSSELST